MRRPYALRSAAALVLAFTAAACSSHRSSSQPQQAPQQTQVEIVTSAGDVVVALDAEHAPKTVANFLHYVNGGFYSGGTFFRAVPGFVIQGGNRNAEKPTDPKLELESPAQTGLKNTDGAISMARTVDPNSATSEFFICDGDQATLDDPPGYAAFGHVVSGMEVVRKIASMPAAEQMLLKPVKIVRIVRLAHPVPVPAPTPT